MKRKAEIFKISFEGKEVIVKVVYNQKNYIRMRISKVNSISIYTYKKLSQKIIYNYLCENKQAILKAWDTIENNKSELKPNEVLLFGHIYSIDEIDYNKEYEKAIKYIESMFYEYRDKYHFPKAVLQFKTIKSAWGICHVRKNRVVLNTFLTSVPLQLTEYVIIHELCHFYVPNHSKAFYDEVSKYYPDYKNARKELRKYSKYL